MDRKLQLQSTCGEVIAQYEVPDNTSHSHEVYAEHLAERLGSLPVDIAGVSVVRSHNARDVPGDDRVVVSIVTPVKRGVNVTGYDFLAVAQATSLLLELDEISG